MRRSHHGLSVWALVCLACGCACTTASAQSGWTDGGSVVRLTTAADLVGIGTTTVGSKVQVAGNAAIGYATSTVAPANGLVVGGSVGVGTTTVPAGTRLAVSGGKITAAGGIDVTGGGLTVTNSTTTVGYMRLSAQDAAQNGAHVEYLGAGSNTTWHHDNWTGRLRWYNGGIERLALMNAGAIDNFAALSGGAALAVASTITNGVFPVTAYGAIPNDAVADDAAFAAALGAATNAGRGIVYVPAGRYILTSNLTIPTGVTLQGTWQGPHGATNAALAAGTPTLGSTLVNAQGSVTSDALSLTGTPFIQLTENSALRGVSIYYSGQQNPNSVSAFPWTVGVVAGADYCVEDVVLCNSYNGIALNQGHGRHSLRNVYMTALRRGVLVDACYDVSVIDRLMIEPSLWAQAQGWMTGIEGPEMQAISQYQLANLEGVVLHRADWEFIQNSFIYVARYGFVLDNGPNGLPSNVVIASCGIDKADLVGIDVRYSLALNGAKIDNCCVGAGIGLWLRSTNTGSVSVANSTFWEGVSDVGNYLNSCESVLNETSDGARAATLALTNCKFWNWGLQNGQHPSVRTGAANATTLITNCDFMDNAPKPAVYAAVGWTAVTNTRTRRSDAIVGGAVQTSNLVTR